MKDARFIIENLDGDTQLWVVMAATDDIEQAESLLTSKHRRIVDLHTTNVIHFDETTR